MRVRDDAGREGELIGEGPGEMVAIEIDVDPDSDPADLPRQWTGRRIDFLCGWREVKDGD